MNNTPKLRFNEFSGDWKYKTLDDLSDKVMVGIASSTTHAYRKSGIIMFRNQNIKPNHLDDTDILYLDEEYEKTHRNKRLIPGDLLTARTGYPGTTCVVPSKYINTQTFTTLITRPTKSLAISEYLSQYINSDRGTKFFKSVEIGGGQKNVNAETLKSLPIFIPTLKEQEKIASFFSLIDDKISLQGEKVEALKDYKTGIMQKIFSRELRFKDDGDRDYPDWEEKRLCEFGEFLKGAILSKSHLSNEGQPCILYGELYTKYGEVIRNIISRTNINNGNIIYGMKNDILMPSSGETSIDIATASCLQEHDVILGGDLNIFRTNKANGMFISYQLNTSKKNEIAKLAQGASVVHIYNYQISKLKIELPHIEEQEKIANFLNKIDLKLEKEQEKLDSLNEYKKGLLQQMFV